MTAIRNSLLSIALLLLVGRPALARVGAPQAAADETLSYSITPERMLDGTQVIHAAYKNNGSYTVTKTKWSVYGWDSDHNDRTKIWDKTYTKDIKSTGEQEIDNKFYYYYGIQRAVEKYAFYSLKLEIWIEAGSNDKGQETGNDKDADTFKMKGASAGILMDKQIPTISHSATMERKNRTSIVSNQSDCNSFKIKCTG